MDRQFHNMSVEDREMFAYNSYQERKQQQLAAIAPELRIKFCFEFLTMVSQSTAINLTGPKHTSDSFFTLTNEKDTPIRNIQGST